MKHKIIKTLLILFAAFCFAFLPVSSTFAAQCSSSVCGEDSGYPDSVKAACGCGNSSSKELPDVVINIINIIIGISGIVAVVFIVIGGINYMTSTGDAGKVKKAKDTIIYAVIGLVICVLSLLLIIILIKKFKKTNQSPPMFIKKKPTLKPISTKLTPKITILPKNNFSEKSCLFPKIVIK